ncbi:MAG: sigma 54-interacting transcriptional regulator [Firmicutes bacterium]|nr:sigma 54-interacting transcriptional regulator [Bacillota bacterium]
MDIDLSQLTTFLTYDKSQGVLVLDDSYIIRDLSYDLPSLLGMYCSSYDELLQSDARQSLPFLFEDGLLHLGRIKLKCDQYIEVRDLKIPHEQGRGLWLIVIRDVTREVMHDVYLRVLNFSRDAFFICDCDGYVMQVNDALTRNEGYTNQWAVGRNLREIYTLFEENEYMTIRALRTKKSYVNERQVYAVTNGKMLDSLVSAYPIIIDDELQGAVCIMEDYAKIDLLTKQIVDLQSRLSDNAGVKKVKKAGSLSTKYTFNDIISRDPQVISCIKKCKMAARTNSSVLIYGETGTGKELFAQSIHAYSHRRDQPFIAINCAAIPENLLEGMLFGTVKGAYTGAENRAGLLEEADGGTLLLDEVNSMPAALQAKLLRVLQDGCIRRLGGTEEKKVDVRFISNINVPPQEAIRRGQLRQDLFYRLGVVSINIPPLRERARDVELLAKNFIVSFNEKMHKNVTDISPEVAELFRRYPWPGNVRELLHAIEHAMNIIPDGKVLIRKIHLPDNITEQAGSNAVQPDDAASYALEEESEKDQLIRILRENGGNITRTAAALEISRQNLQYRLKKHKINVKELQTGKPNV